MAFEDPIKCCKNEDDYITIDSPSSSPEIIRISLHNDEEGNMMTLWLEGTTIEEFGEQFLKVWDKVKENSK